MWLTPHSHTYVFHSLVISIASVFNLQTNTCYVSYFVTATCCIYKLTLSHAMIRGFTHVTFSFKRWQYRWLSMRGPSCHLRILFVILSHLLQIVNHFWILISHHITFWFGHLYSWCNFYSLIIYTVKLFLYIIPYPSYKLKIKKHVHSSFPWYNWSHNLLKFSLRLQKIHLQCHILVVTEK